MNRITNQSNRKTGFNPQSTYEHEINEYFLLPIRFHRLNEVNEIIVNEVGDFLIVPDGTVDRIVHRQLDPLKDRELYADLVSSFFISEERVPPLLDILATRYRTKKSFLDSFTGLHIFVITLRCNQSCQYCQVSRVSEDQYSSDMSLKNIDLGIAMMMQSPNPHVTMEFQGGEPLLAFQNIQYAVEKTKELAFVHNKKVTFVLCTNLSEINDNILNYCKVNDILISTSLDGPEFIHNHNRRRQNNDSYQRTIEGIQRARDIVGYGNVSALMTASPYSLEYPVEIVEEYYHQGFRNIFLRPISPYGYAATNLLQSKFDIEKFIEFYKKALTRILEYNFNGEIFREIYTKIILEKMLTPFNVGYVDLLSPAGIINSVVVFNYDGKVYASDESRMLAEMGDFTFQLGDLEKNSYGEIFNGAKAHEIALTWSNEALAGCSECAFQSYCGADPVRYYATQGDMYGYRPSSAHCIKNKEIISYLFELMDSDKKIEHIFRTWISPPGSKTYDSIEG